MAQRTKPYRFERLVMLGLAVALVVAMLAFVFLNPSLNATTRLVLYVLVSMMAGGFIAFLPGGALQIGNDIKGIAIKATGGAAAFVIVLWLLFTYTGEGAGPELADLGNIDLRSQYRPGDDRQAEGPVVMIIPIAFRDPDGQNVPIRSLRATLTLGADPVSQFVPRSFATVPALRDHGPWIQYLGDYADGGKFPSETPLEIAFFPRSGLRWQAFLDRVADIDSGFATVEVVAEMTDGAALVQTCRFDLRPADLEDGKIATECRG